MARATTWRRNTFYGGSTLPLTVALIHLNAGETLGRVRMSARHERVSDPNSLPDPFLNVASDYVTVQGLIVYAAADPVNAGPIQAPDDEWLWWGAMLPEQYSFQWAEGSGPLVYNTAQIENLTSVPPELDVKAQRRVDPAEGSADLYWQADAVQGGARPGTVELNWRLAVSALVLLPPA